MIDRAFDEAMGALDPPAVIVTAAAGGRRAGCLVTFSTQVSIHPRRYLICLARVNATFAVADAAATLAVHVVPDDAGPLARLFGGRTGDDVDKFGAAAWRPWEDGTPLLDGCAWFVGRIVARHDLGDHVGYVLEPVAASSPVAGQALRLRDVRGIRPGHAL